LEEKEFTGKGLPTFGYRMRIAGFFIRLIAFWLVFFALGRLVSVVYQIAQVSQDPSGIPMIFISGLRLDLATISALLILPLLAWTVHALTGWKAPERIVHGLNCVLVVLLSAIVAGELELVREWGSKVNYQALSYLAYPTEALASASSSPLGLLFLILVLLAAGSLLLYRAMFRGHGFARPAGWPQLLLVVLLGPALLFLGVRGGWQEIGINTSSAYFSTSRMHNLIAVNPGWSVVESIYAARSTSKNPFKFFPMDEARAEARKFFVSGEHRSILTRKKPNVVLLILESWTADVVPSLGGETGVAPNFEKLVSEGLLFTRFYASGARSAQGLVAVLSGFPAMSHGAYDSRRLQSLPCLAEELERAGYSTAFLYGGDLNFASFRAYMTFCGFDKITGMEDFPIELRGEKWGVHDQHTLQRQIENMRNAKTPFFSALFTLSSHEPFVVPMETPFKGQDLPDKFRGAVYYSDFSLGQYFEKVRKEPWYKDTVFILVADHGHRLPKEKLDGTPERYHIPLLILGEPLREELRGKKDPRIGSQVDIVATLLAELGLSATAFPWSKDLLSYPGSSFAYYAFDEGFGLIEENRSVVYHDLTGRWVVTDRSGVSMARAGGDANEAVKPGQAMMQTIYQDFMELR
jgi:phosphoglycerol transferase MdoB-like AlkP superfamily enzyme